MHVSYWELFLTENFRSFIIRQLSNILLLKIFKKFQDLCPKTNAISLDRSSNGGTTSAGASNVATNYIPNHELQSFKDAHELFGDVLASKKLTSLSKKTILRDLTCAGQVRRLTRSGWGIPIGLGLKGGAGGETSVANGTSGWGPPPSGAVSGWGAPPPPNPAASAAWGAPNPGQGPKPTPNGEYN